MGKLIPATTRSRSGILKSINRMEEKKRKKTARVSQDTLRTANATTDITAREVRAKKHAQSNSLLVPERSR